MSVEDYYYDDDWDPDEQESYNTACKFCGNTIWFWRGSPINTDGSKHTCMISGQKMLKKVISNNPFGR